MSNTNGISIDQSALERITALRASDAIANFSAGTMLRVAVEGGGCSGFQYKILPDNTVNDDDIVFHDAVVVDEISAQYLKDSIIKYQNDLMSAMFVVENPNATSSCGCSASFSIDPSKL